MASEAGPPKRWSVVVAAGLLALLAMLDMGAVTVALPAIGADLGLGVGAVAWVVLAYQIPLVLGLLPAGRLIDARPVRPLALGGLAVFAVTGILAIGTPPGPVGLAWLVALRVVQGAAASVLFVLMPVLATGAVGPRHRARALSVTASLGPLGAVLGPALGGPVVDAWGWRWVLVVKLLPALVAWAILALRLPAGSGAAEVSWRRIGVEAVATVRGVLVGRSLAPLIGATLALALALQAMQFTTSIHLQGLGASASRTGSVLMVFAVCMAGVGLVAGRLADAVGAAVISIAGAVGVVVGLAALVALPGSASVPDMVWRLAIVGVGMGLYGGPTQAWIMSRAERGRLGAVAAVMQLARATGFALGPYAAGLLLATTDGPAASFGLALAAAVVAVLCLGGVRLARR